MTHAFTMIDVGAKPPTDRRAAAMGKIFVGEHAFQLVKARALPKGDALILAEIAGIQGAKRASDSIPLCHPLALDQVKIITQLEDDCAAVTVFCFVAAHAKTGVEMEALAGVNAALLTIYDLVKMVEPALRLEGIRLLVKTGGKKGIWLAPDGVPSFVLQAMGVHKQTPPLQGCRAAVVTLSDRAAEGIYKDEAGPLLAEILTNAGACVASTLLIPDDLDTIMAALKNLIAKDSPALIVTTGGTGVGPRDVTPEALAALGGREIPGLGERLRQYSASITPNAWSSRATAAIVGQTLVLLLPGRPKAVRESMACLLPLLPHLLATIEGKKHD